MVGDAGSFTHHVVFVRALGSVFDDPNDVGNSSDHFDEPSMPDRG
jgi:hypothetical protein